MQNDPDIIFYGTIKNGKRLYWKPNLHQTLISSLEGKVFEEIIRERIEPSTDDQRGYLFGAIIRKTCMNTELFGGWTEDEIYDFFAGKFFSVKKTVIFKGKEYTIKKPLSLNKRNGAGKKRVSEFISRIVEFLANEGIEVQDPSSYKLNSYSKINR